MYIYKQNIQNQKGEKTAETSVTVRTKSEGKILIEKMRVHCRHLKW